MSRRERKSEIWRRAKSRMDRVTGPDKFKVLREELQREGISEAEMIRRVVEDRLGKSPPEDQVRVLAASFSSALGMKPDRFITLWREDLDRR